MSETFDTLAEAQAYVNNRVDVRIADSTQDLGKSLTLHSYSQELGNGAFTNVYDLSFPVGALEAGIDLQTSLTSVVDHLATSPALAAVSTGGFFFMADRANQSPRHPALNLAITNGVVQGLPVRDREAVISAGGVLKVEQVAALGAITLDNLEVSWSGSLTPYDTDTKIFGNGNSIITHVHSDVTGRARVLDETSRMTPAISDDNVDVGYIRREDGIFVGINHSNTGKLNIFDYDVVVRMNERHVQNGLPDMGVRTIGSIAVDRNLRGAISVGPMLETSDFTNHPVNSDKSLGSEAPFLDIPLARFALYQTDDNIVHLRLFDGRPGSPVFTGVTPRQAAEMITSESNIIWGAFLDSGQTAKVVVREPASLKAYGNSHYLSWPKQPGDKFVWVPESGRPVASMIVLR